MKFLRFVCRILFKIFVPTKVFYPERLPETGACIIAANHETMLDFFMIGYRVKRKINWMAKAELFKFKPFGKLITRCGAYPVKRGQTDIGAVTHTMELLDSGEPVGIFPQGTRSRGRGLNLQAKPGFLRLALEHHALIVPVAIWGKIRLFGKVYVKFGEPLDPESLIEPGKTGDREALKAAAQRYLEHVYAMMEVTDEDKKS